MSERLSHLEAELHDKVKHPGADLIEVGVEIGLKIEKALEGIKQIEEKMD